MGGPKQIKVIAYYRVSTEKQGRSGLGLDAQVDAVKRYVESNSCHIIAGYREVETGKRSDRPELAKALSHANRSRALLVFAKLDRLARNARFLLGIVESGADVVFCDFPNIPPGPAGKFMLTQFAAVAELEAGLISERTRAALKAFKDGNMIPARFRDPRLFPDGPPPEAEAYRGLLGSRRPGAYVLKGGANPHAARRAGEVSRAGADAAYEDLAGPIAAMSAAGMPTRAIAAALNDEGHTTRRGRPWNHVQVGRVLKRAGANGNRKHD